MMIARQRSGQYGAKLSVDTIYTLSSMYIQFGILKSNIVKPYLQTVFPKNKNVTKYNIWSLKRQSKEISKEVGSLDDFVTFKANFKSSNLEVGIEEMSTEFLQEIISLLLTLRKVGSLTVIHLVT